MVKSSKILICINNPVSAENAIEYACLMANKYDNVVELLTIIDNEIDSYQGLFAVGKKLSNDKRKNAEEWLSTLCDKIYKQYNLNPVVNIKEGSVSEEIEQTIKNDNNIKMLVLPSSNESTSNGKLIPHITEKILDISHIPISIIPSTLTKTQIKDLL
ncbi:MAG: universal stress protein [Rickettsiales bacterium]|nr:universal stress protein [Rickettsiales bacterium]